MIIDCKVIQPIGERFKTEKGGLIQEFLVKTNQGNDEVVKLHAGAKSIAALVALKAGDVFKAKLPENFFFLQA